MKTRGLFLSDEPDWMKRVWGPEQRERLRKLAEVPERVFDSSTLTEDEEWLEKTEVIFSTWGMPLLTSEQLAAMPCLRAVFFAAGSVKKFAAPLLERDITVVSAWAANSVPVAEYILSQVLFGMKLGWAHIRQMRESPGPVGWGHLDIPGAYGGTVGIVSLGMVGRHLCELLRPFSLNKLAYDPFVDEEEMRRLGVRSAELEEIFQRSQVVSLHLPRLPKTEGMIDGKLLSLMKPNATLINTARGSVINEEEMCDVLRARPDITAVLDVVTSEPLPADSPLYRLPNIVITPHIAGSMGKEVTRMADWMIDEFTSWKAGRPLRYAITAERLSLLA
jgi:phosphoglycerate dehydrogenase-like enzyme